MALELIHDDITPLFQYFVLVVITSQAMEVMMVAYR